MYKILKDVNLSHVINADVQMKVSTTINSLASIGRYILLWLSNANESM
jgi:hypothetical protein